jgi:tetratricopeptide (TPR) repeat protein
MIESGFGPKHSGWNLPYGRISFIAKPMRRAYIGAMRGIAVAFLVLLFASFASGQSADELNKLRIAQALEQSGEYEKALDFYRQLYQTSPSNFVYFDGLRRSYMSLKKYDEAEKLVGDRLKGDPSNVVMLCQLGDVYFKNGRQDSAMATWNRALVVDPKDPNTYKTVAGIMGEDRLFDEAVGVYRKGEIATDSKTIFSNDIARLYFLHASYAESLRELLTQLEANQAPSALQNIEAQIGVYCSSKDAIDQFISEMEKEVSTKPSDTDYRRLLGFLYMQKKDYPPAYTAYKWLDERSGAPGSELLQFAAIAYDDEAYDVAASAYSEVAGLSKDRLIVVRALAGNAGSLQKLGENIYAEEDRPCSITDSLRELSQALSGYKQIIDKYSDTQFLGAAVLGSVGLKMRYFHDLSGAEKLLSDYVDRLRPLTSDWTLLRIRLYMMEGKFQDALSTALNAAQLSRSGTGKMSIQNAPAGSSYDRIEFQAATALYYLGLYDSSVYYLKQISSNPMSDAANDAIQLLNTITNNRGIPPALRLFASAIAMEESDQIPEAAAALENLLNQYPNVPLAGNARFNLAVDYCRLGNVVAALKNYSALAEDSTGLFADKAEYRICRIYENTLRENQKAIDEYENFLVRFPNSIYQNKVREILKGLLGENS